MREHWGDTLEPPLVEHIELTPIAVAIGFVLAFGLALLAHRATAARPPFCVVAALIYTIPSLAIFQILCRSRALDLTTSRSRSSRYSLVILTRTSSPASRRAARGARGCAWDGLTGSQR